MRKHPLGAEHRIGGLDPSGKHQLLQLRRILVPARRGEDPSWLPHGPSHPCPQDRVGRSTELSDSFRCQGHGPHKAGDQDMVPREGGCGDPAQMAQRGGGLVPGPQMRSEGEAVPPVPRQQEEGGPEAREIMEVHVHGLPRPREQGHPRKPGLRIR